ncbi:MAG TPA: multiheme c-type cytochrome, partial [Dongiaceae bacterium]|nr:multiheme c-type cytochrome [Dongiaceae bacterium]
MADELGRMGEAGVGLGERDLHFGLGFLRAVVAHGGTPIVCANLVAKPTGAPVFAPYRIVHAGGVTVGVFGLLAPHADLGPSRDSLAVLDPVATAAKVLGELKAKGATVIVLLSSLGKVDSEDLVVALEGIDLVIPSRDIPLVQAARRVRGTLFLYGGEQGHYIGVSDLTVGANGRVAGGDGAMFMLGPDVPENATVLARVTAFEDQFNEHERRRQKERADAVAAATGDNEPPPSHYVGAEVCGRCHAKEYAQWRTTAHAHAWQTLVDQRKDATPECVVCHVVGYRKSGGFETGADAARLGNVQCENCHGMGTEHESWPATHGHVPEA